MKVKITGCSSQCYWYAGRIGEVLEVEKQSPSTWDITDDFDYCSIDNDGLRGYIRACDCVVLDETEETLVKPPIGLRPRHIADSLRIKEIVEAINRYVEVDKAIPQEWIDELSDKIGRN